MEERSKYRIEKSLQKAFQTYSNAHRNTKNVIHFRALLRQIVQRYPIRTHWKTRPENEFKTVFVKKRNAWQIFDSSLTYIVFIVFLVMRNHDKLIIISMLININVHIAIFIIKSQWCDHMEMRKSRYRIFSLSFRSETENIISINAIGGAIIWPAQKCLFHRIWPSHPMCIHFWLSSHSQSTNLTRIDWPVTG